MSQEVAGGCRELQLSTESRQQSLTSPAPFPSPACTPSPIHGAIALGAYHRTMGEEDDAILSFAKTASSRKV
jgi:hypothetical protein